MRLDWRTASVSDDSGGLQVYLMTWAVSYFNGCIPMNGFDFDVSQFCNHLDTGSRVEAGWIVH